MIQGREHTRQLQRALSQDEHAIVRREQTKLLDSSVSVQQHVDTARQKVVDTVAQIVTTVKLNR